MKPCFLGPLLSNRRLTLRRFEEYKTGEMTTENMKTFVAKQVKRYALAPDDEDTLTRNFSKIFSEQRKCTYIQCFYDDEYVTENHLARFGGLGIGFDKEKLIQRCNESKVQKQYGHYPLIKVDNVSYIDDNNWPPSDFGMIPEDWANSLLFNLRFLFLKSQPGNHDEKEFRIAKNYRVFCYDGNNKFSEDRLTELGKCQKALYYGGADNSKETLINNVGAPPRTLLKGLRPLRIPFNQCFPKKFAADGACRYEHINIELSDIVGISLIKDNIEARVTKKLLKFGLSIGDNLLAFSNVRRYNVSSH
jgi:hypothetical protein